MGAIKLVVFDMAGTTVKDHDEVLHCFQKAAVTEGLTATPERINAMMGLPKKVVFATLWKEQLGDRADCEVKIESSYARFQTILEQHYRTQPVEPTAGCLELFAWLRTRGIAIALNTGFYRKVTDIILARLGWDRGLGENYVGGADSIIDVSVTPSEIYSNEGRPAPYMIQKAMYLLGVRDPQSTIAIGDTPSDLQAATAAHCRLALGVTCGTHTREQLARYPNDGLLDSLAELPTTISGLV